jgi:hypothetical protein
VKKLDILRALFVIALLFLCFKAVKAEELWVEGAFICTENAAYVVGLAYQDGGSQAALKELNAQAQGRHCGVYSGGVTIIQKKHTFMHGDLLLILAEARPHGNTNTFWMFLFKKSTSA